MPIELRLDDGALRRYLTGPQSEAVRLVRDGQRTTLNAAKTGSPVDTGQLRNSHRAGPIRVRAVHFYVHAPRQVRVRDASANCYAS